MSIVAGADSNMPTLGWTIAYLIQNPEWQSRLYQALKEHILEQGGDLNEGPGYATAEENTIPIIDVSALHPWSLGIDLTDHLISPRPSSVRSYASSRHYAWASLVLRIKIQCTQAAISLQAPKSFSTSGL